MVRSLKVGWGAQSSVSAPTLWDVALRVWTRSALLGALDVFPQDVLVAVGRKLEEPVWMMRAQLPA